MARSVKKIGSDNGSQFKSTEFQIFFERNGISYLPTAPAYPSINGAAENSVRSSKRA